MEGKSSWVLAGDTTVSEVDGRHWQASGRGRKGWVQSRKVLERNKLVVELHTKDLVLHMMALHFCCFHKQ